MRPLTRSCPWHHGAAAASAAGFYLVQFGPTGCRQPEALLWCPFERTAPFIYTSRCFSFDKFRDLWARDGNALPSTFSPHPFVEVSFARDLGAAAAGVRFPAIPHFYFLLHNPFPQRIIVDIKPTTPLHKNLVEMNLTVDSVS